MKRYNLRVFYPSSNESYSTRSQFYNITVEAFSFITENISIIFLDSDGETIYLYPANYTIIRSIEEL